MILIANAFQRFRRAEYYHHSSDISGNVFFLQSVKVLVVAVKGYNMPGRLCHSPFFCLLSEPGAIEAIAKVLVMAEQPYLGVPCSDIAAVIYYLFILRFHIS